MRDFSSWSINLGRASGVHVRLHALFLLFSVFAIYVSTHDPDRDLVVYGFLSLGILLLSVLAHEIGHCLAAIRVGGSADQIVIGPLGGLAHPTVPHEPQAELIAAIGGPLVNLVICLATAPIIVCSGENLLGLLRPLNPQDMLLGGAPWLIPIKITFWLNWLLVLINLVVPAFPFDGGRILRSLLWRASDYRTAVLSVAWAAKLVAGMLWVAAWFWRDETTTGLVPLWVPLVVLGIFLFFSAKQEAARLDEQDLDEDLFNYDFSQGYTSLERNGPSQARSPAGSLRRWMELRRQARQRKRQQLEQDEERRVDEILARLHEGGMARLSPKERALLERASARYRNRLQS